MLDSLYYIISFLLVITLIVFVHEFGHYIAAKRAGVKVLKFSIGMGPEVFGFTDKDGTRWCFSAIPVGGFVMMLGDEDISSAQASGDIDKLSEEDKKRAFHLKSNWQKMWISFCGPFANYIYAFVVMVLLFAFVGVPDSQPYVHKVLDGSPAQTVGIMNGDLIKSINDKEIKRSEHVPAIINSIKSDKLAVVVDRGGVEIKFELSPAIKENKSIFGKKKEFKYIGVTFDHSKYDKVSFLESIKQSFLVCVNTTVSMFMLFKKLFSGQQSMDSLGGFVYMASVTGDIAKSGDFIMLIMFTVTLSLNLGFINLLPFPVVDGGNILVNFIEQCLGRPINRKIMDYVMTGGVICLILLMLFTTLNDILRLESVSNLVSKFLK